MKRTIILSAVLISFPSAAYAYVDPGSGSLILQMLMALGVGAMFYFRRIKHYIKGLFSGESDQEKEEETARHKS